MTCTNRQSLLPDCVDRQSGQSNAVRFQYYLELPRLNNIFLLEKRHHLRKEKDLYNHDKI